MVKCPFCNFENEDGALFCEQCKSDLGAMAPAASAEDVPMAAVLDEPIPMSPIHSPSAAVPAAHPIPMAEFHEAMPVAAVVDNPPLLSPVAPAPTPMPAAPPEPSLAPAAAAPSGLDPLAAPVMAAADSAPSHAATGEPSAPAPTEGAKLPTDAKPKLVVVRGQRVSVEYPIYEGLNFIGRADEKPVDIDLDDQEPPDKVWCSRQHALVNFEEGTLTIEDLNSANGTYVNRTKVYPGQKRTLSVNDVIQIGTVHMKVKV